VLAPIHSLAVKLIWRRSEQHGHDPANPLRALIGVFRGLAAREQILAPCRQVFGQRPPRIVAIRGSLGIDQALANVRSLGLQDRRHALGLAPIGAALPVDHPAVRVDIPETPVPPPPSERCHVAPFP
jgi:hypothetical protein